MHHQTLNPLPKDTAFANNTHSDHCICVSTTSAAIEDVTEIFRGNINFLLNSSAIFIYSIIENVIEQ